MKLSDVRGERTFDVIAEVIGPIANIAEDPATAKLFEPGSVPEGMDRKSYLFGRAKKFIPVLLRNHKVDLISILATIEGISTEEYSKSLNLAKLTKDCLDLLFDEAFQDFFQQADTSCGDVSGSTEALTD